MCYHKNTLKPRRILLELEHELCRKKMSKCLQFKWKSFYSNRLMAQRFYSSRKCRRFWDCGGKISSYAAAGIQLTQKPPSSLLDSGCAEVSQVKSSALLEGFSSSASGFC